MILWNSYNVGLYENPETNMGECTILPQMIQRRLPPESCKNVKLFYQPGALFTFDIELLADNDHVILVKKERKKYDIMRAFMSTCALVW